MAHLCPTGRTTNFLVKMSSFSHRRTGLKASSELRPVVAFVTASSIFLYRNAFAKYVSFDSPSGSFVNERNLLGKEGRNDAQMCRAALEKP